MGPGRVVVTGIGVVAPNAHGAEAFARALRERRSGIRFHEPMRAMGLRCQVVGIPEGVDAVVAEYLEEDERLTMNTNMVYAAIAAIDAWEDAGIPRGAPDAVEPDWDSGAVIGTGFGGIETVAERLVPQVDAKQVARLGGAMTEQTMVSGNSARVGGLLGLGNQVTTNSAACSTGLEAIVEAYHRVRSRRATRMLAGGSDGPSRHAWAGMDALRVLSSKHNDAPEKASRPLSASAGGFVPAAGAGVLLLENLDAARARSARIYAEVIAGHSNCGGHRGYGSMTAPNPDAVRRCIREAVTMAGVAPSDVDLVNGHFTATFFDPHEMACWASALDLPPGRMPFLQATKSLIGHTLGASGAIETAAAVLQLHHGFVHGSVNCEDIHPAIAPYEARIARDTIDRPLRIVAKASFGFGDVNACALFRKLEG
jgi:3-oxoacyl-(acyl-carrier-protein) synthase